MTPAPPLPGVFHHLGPLLDHYGYLAIAGFIFLEDFGVPLPGETVLIAAAVYAGTGRLNIFAVATLGVLAAVLGDNVGYLIGRYAGRAFVLRWGRYVFLTADRLDSAEGWFSRHGGKVVTIARFVGGLRQANGIIAGLTRMRWRGFLAFNALGAVLWVALWSSVGYLSGNHINAVYRTLSRTVIYLAATAMLVGTYRVIRHMQRRHSHSDMTAPHPACPDGAHDDERHHPAGHTDT